MQNISFRPAWSIHRDNTDMAKECHDADALEVKWLMLCSVFAWFTSCQVATFLTDHHECVTPVHQPSAGTPSL